VTRPARHRLAAIGDGGSVAVEYALCLPFLLAIIYGIVEIGHFGYLRISMSNVAHDAARYAMVHSSTSAQPKTSADVVTFASNELVSLGLNPNGTGGTAVTATYSPDNSPGNKVNVRISYPFVPFMPGFDAVPGSRSTFTALAGPVLGLATITLVP
jgi:Flp pilus assembly protein TadG